MAIPIQSEGAAAQVETFYVTLSFTTLEDFTKAGKLNQ
jgi:hypothetical protein